METFEIDVEKLEKIIKESFPKNVNGQWSITCYILDGRKLIEIVYDGWIGVYLSALNAFAKRLCDDGIIENSSKNFWIFNAFREKNDYGSLGILIDVTDTWYPSLKPKPKSKIKIEIKHEEEPTIIVDRETWGQNKEDIIRKIIAERQLQKEG